MKRLFSTCLSHCCEGILTQSSLKHRFSSLRCVDMRLYTALCGSHHSISISLRSELLDHCNTLILLFFRHSVIDFLICLGSLSFSMNQFQQSFSCQTDGLTLDSRIFWYTEEFMVYSESARCTSPVSEKQAQNNPPFTTVLDSLCEVSVLMFCAWISLDYDYNELNSNWLELDHII